MYMIRELTIPATVAEYFAGIGLVRMGLEPCGWSVAFANDISWKKYEMYKAFFSDADKHYRVQDVFNIDPSSIPETILATCSFPCVDLSLAGNMNGINGRHSSAFWGFVRTLRGQGDAAPPLVLVENVPGWLLSNQGADFRLTVAALNELGYTCDVFVLDALRFVPQSRLRVFLVGTKLAVDEALGRTFARPRSLLPESLRSALLANLDLHWFCADLPQPPPLLTAGLADIVERLDQRDSRWWSEAEVQRHLAMMSESHRQIVFDLQASPNVGYRTFYRRVRNDKQRAEVRSDEVAGCLRTAVGGSGKQFLVAAGNGSVRMRTMTPREYARLQGVPDSYPITVTDIQALTGFGDAVCVPVISWVARYALNPLVEQYLPGVRLYQDAPCLTT